MQSMNELKAIFNLVVAQANPIDNPRYEILKSLQDRMDNAIIEAIKSDNHEFSQMDYEDEISQYIVDWCDECCLDAFAKGIAFALNFKSQAERFANKGTYNF